MPEGTPFGPGIASTVTYLHGCQMVGYKRLTEVCEGLFGLSISQGAIANMLARVGEAFAAPAERIAEEVRASEVIASDETSARVKGKTWWQWTFGCATACYFVIAETRGKRVPTAFLDGARPLVWLSDRLPAQCKHAEEHQFCLAHLIRNAQYAIDHGDAIFAPGFKALLKDACAAGRRRPDLADATIAAHRRRLEKELERLLALKPTDAEGRKLRDAVALDCRGKLFVFLKRRDVEPTNNESERALRPSVILPQSDERVPLRVGRESLRRPLLHCRNRPPQRPERSHSHPRRPGHTRGRRSRRVISARGVSNYQVRVNMLEAYGYALLEKQPKLRRVIGIAREPNSDDPKAGVSEDLAMLEDVVWTDELKAKLAERKKAFNMMTEGNFTERPARVANFPNVLNAGTTLASSPEKCAAGWLRLPAKRPRTRLRAPSLARPLRPGRLEACRRARGRQGQALRMPTGIVSSSLPA